MSAFTTTRPGRQHALQVQVRPEYLPHESRPQEGRYVFAYHVTITNTGRVATQVVARHWIITDSNGHTEEVKGLAVVGRQPILEPGEQFSYTSGTPLATPRGTMQGSFFCVTVDGERFDAPIAPFMLDAGTPGRPTGAQLLH